MQWQNLINQTNKVTDKDHSQTTNLILNQDINEKRVIKRPTKIISKKIWR